ncbi:MAG: GlxA family transcriptional regulator [Haliangiales bacterium]
MDRELTALRAPRRVGVVVLPGFQSLDAFGPIDVFQAANQQLAAGGQGRLGDGAGHRGGYQIELWSPQAGPVRSSAGVSVVAERPLRAVRGAVDTVVVAGGDPAVMYAEVSAISWLKRWAPRVRRVASVCTGSFLLAEAGLLDRRRATTHWRARDEFAGRYPQVLLEPDSIYVCDDGVYTSAGVTAGIDLALALVEEDLGAEVALAVARYLVLYLRRSGGQTQYSAHMERAAAATDNIAAVQRYIAEQPGADLSVEALAAQAGMSPRHFARVFRAEVGVTPARYVQEMRVEAARWSLERSRASIDEIAASCGLGSGETMRRAFLRVLGTTPAGYRAHFRTA